MNNNKVKKVGLILSLITIISLIVFNQRTIADIPNKPSFDLEMSATPDPAMIGEDITVNGLIKPRPFETDIPAKEIVLVLDTSGSMADSISSNGKKTTKMEELKKATKSFIETMSDVENLKIGIVQYSSLATINPSKVNGEDKYYPVNRNERELTVPKYDSKGEKFIDINSQELDSMIENLKAEGGTNIGEGIRRAIYMLQNGDPAANKTIVLMTDGLPTFYSLKKTKLSYEDWKSTWKTEWWGGKQPDSWTQGISEEKVKAAFDNWYSYKESINESDFDTWKDQWSGWDYLTDSEKGKIKDAFMNYLRYNRYKTSYEEYYDIDNVQPYYIGGSGSDLDNKSLEYAKYMANIIKEKGYNAYSVGYGMDNKGNNTFKSIHSAMTGNELNNNIDENEKKGYYETSDNIGGIFNNIATEIINSYPVNNLALNISFEEGFTLNIGGNKVDIGNITYRRVEQSSSTNKIRYEADEIPFSFIIKASKEGHQEIISGINISYIFNNESLTQDLEKSISINIESNELPKIGVSLVSAKEIQLNKGEEFNVKYKLTPQDFQFNDVNNATEKDVILLIDNSSLVNDKAFNSLKSSIFNKLLNNTTLKNTGSKYSVITFSDEAEKLTDFTDNITQLNDNIIKNINKNSSSTANLDKAVDLINETFLQGREDVSKNLIIMAQDDVDYSSSKISELGSKGYNIIILSLGDGQGGNLLNLKYNTELAIDKDNIFITGSDGNNIQNSIMAKLTDRLISLTKYKPYIFNPEININLLGDFEIIEGGTMVSETAGKIVSDKKVVYNNTVNNVYHAEPIEIEFKVKIKAEEPGTYKFGNTVLSYESLIGGYKQVLLETPKITLKEEVKELVHGLYSGLSGNEIKIEKSDDSKGFKIIGESTVTFGAKFKATSDKIKATLEIDSKFDLSNSEFEVYKVVESEGKAVLTKLDQVNNKINTNYLDIQIDNIETNGVETKLVIVYKVKVKTDSVNELFENKITIGSLSESVNIYTPANPIHNEEDPRDKLPDLF